MAKPFCENRRGARCFAELFGTCISETIYGLVKPHMTDILNLT
jgi:hypothetical protein